MLYQLRKQHTLPRSTACPQEMRQGLVPRTSQPHTHRAVLISPNKLAERLQACGRTTRSHSLSTDSKESSIN